MSKKIKRIDIAGYNGLPVETLFFDCPLNAEVDDINVRDFIITNIEEVKNGIIITLQFDGNDIVYDIYDIDEKTDSLLNFITNSYYNEEDDLDTDELYEKIHSAIKTILNPDSSTFSEEFEENL